MKRLDRGPSAMSCGAAALTALLTVLAIAGCGGSGGETTAVTRTSSPEPVERPSDAASPRAQRASKPEVKAKAEEKPPTALTDKPTTKTETYSQAGKPLPPARSEAAREAGKRACAGMTPPEAAEHFEIPARLAGVDKKFAEFVADPPTSTAGSAGYPRLVAALYATTVPAAEREEAAAGCTEELTPPSGG